MTQKKVDIFTRARANLVKRMETIEDQIVVLRDVFHNEPLVFYGEYDDTLRLTGCRLKHRKAQGEVNEDDQEHKQQMFG